MKLLVTGAWRCSDSQLTELRALGNEIVFMQDERGKLPCAADWVEGVICNGLFLHHDIKRFSSLCYIQLTSAGFDRVPMDYVKEHEIAIHNAKGVYSIPMAEFALCGVLDLYKKSRFFYDNQKESKWEKNRTVLELFGKNVLIVGCGNVGTECAKRFYALGTHVRGIDLYPRSDSNYESVVGLVNLTSELSLADIVVLTLPLTEETKHIINKHAFAAMKKGAVLVNIARGAVVDTDAMIEALDSKLLGAVLDVFEEEPLFEDSPLWQMPNVIATPHNSFVGEGNDARLFACIKENLRGKA